MSLKLLREETPDYIAFCFDRPDPSFRKEIDPNYKANRSEMPEDLVPQMPYMRRIGEVLGITCLDRQGFEADDLIGTLARWGEKQNFQVSIVSGDKDFGQLVNEKISLMDTMKNLRLGPAEVKEKWGVSPQQMRDYLAIVGDTSDNIPGVHGIGPKGAQKLLEEFGTLEEIYRNVEKVKGSTKDKLIESKDKAFMSQKLVTIVTDVDLPAEPKDYTLDPVKVAQLDQLLEELNFKALRKNLELLPNWSSGQTSQAPLESAKAISTTEAGLPEKEAGLPMKESGIPSSEAQLQSRHQLGLTEVSPQNFKSPKDIWIFNLPSGLFFADQENSKVFQAQGETADWKAKFDLDRPKFHGFNLKSLFHSLKLENPLAAWDSCVASYVI
jgi:DNA polymerase I